jgi:tRNA N6-adenosine threonylcarbamoyltransferase
MVLTSDRPDPGVITREMRAGDLPAMVAIERESFASPWTPEMLADELGQKLGWSTVAVEPGSRVVGFLIGRRYPDVWHIMDLAVAVDRRRRGVARSLLAGFLAAADAEGRPVLLEVRRGNGAAVMLYRSEGFVTLSMRRRYYPDTGEDALVMVREHCGGEWGAGESDRDAEPGPGAELNGIAEPGGLLGPLLAIESSCDDSAAAVLGAGGEVLASVIHSQDAIHERYGGVVPEVASRAHVERMTVVVREALRQAGCGVDDLGGVAATVGPGLIGALLVGVQTAKTIAWSRRLPFFPVNHIHGHLAAAWLSDPQAPLPMVTLVASGGHTLLIKVDDHTTFRLLGETLDDAAGEAFDKGARLLGLGYPGGRELDELAEQGQAGRFSFPVGLRRSLRPDFSFSGVKTALYYLLRGMTPKDRAEAAADLAASYREAIVSALVGKTLRATEQEGANAVAVVGGVAANSLLRRRLVEEGEKAGLRVVVPPFCYCTDNAAMIGAAALAGPRLEYPRYLSIDATASLPLGEWFPRTVE